jgi:succinate-acetate transporter protein
VAPFEPHNDEAAHTKKTKIKIHLLFYFLEAIIFSILAREDLISRSSWTAAASIVGALSGCFVTTRPGYDNGGGVAIPAMASLF